MTASNSLDTNSDYLLPTLDSDLPGLPASVVATDNHGVEHVDYRLLGATLPARLLEVGCGRGWQSMELAQTGFQTWGVDISLDLLKDFRQRLEVTPAIQKSCLPLVGSAFELPFPDHTFDVVFCTEVLEHLYEPERAVREIARVLAPTGKVFITVPSVISERVLGTIHRRWREYNGHVRSLPEAEVRAWLTNSGLETYATRKLGFEWAGFWLPHSLLQTPFDVTGLPARHDLVSRGYWKVWRGLDKLGAGRYLRRKGNVFFPKSLAFYARKSAGS